MRYLGEQTKVVFLNESGTYANPSGTGQWLGLVQENSIDENLGITQARYLGNMSRNVGVFIDTTKDYTGELSLYPQDFRLLGYALGSIANTSGTTNTHTFTELNGNVANGYTAGANNPWISFTLEDSKTTNTGSNFIRTLKGCIVDELHLKGAEGEIVELSASYIAQDCVYSSGAATAVTAQTITPYLWSDFSVHLTSGNRYENLKDFDFGVKNNFEAPHYVNGSRVIGIPIPGNREYNFDLTIHLDDVKAKELYDQYYLGGSEFNCILDGTKSATRYLIVTLSGCKLLDMEVPSKFEGPTETALKIVPKSCSAETKDSVYRFTAF